MYEPSSGSMLLDDTPARVPAGRMARTPRGAFQDFPLQISRETFGRFLGDVRMDEEPAVLRLSSAGPVMSSRV
jgi:hypothetical protein